MRAGILLSSAEMRQLEGDAIESGLVTGLELMERAGQGAADAIEAEWPDLAGRGAAVVLCGPGNNGGDGFVVARILAERDWHVQVGLYGDPDRLPPDARTAHDRWRLRGEVRDLMVEGWARDPGRGRPSVAVDAVFGTGLARPLDDQLARALHEFDADWLYRKVALDVPSGLCADSGRVLGEAGDDGFEMTPIQADLTVAFHAAKPGHHLQSGPANCGRVRIVPIGLDTRFGKASLVAHPTTTMLAKGGEETPVGHKYSYGHVLVLAGGAGRGGAARLAARAALRAGAGLVTVGCPPEALTENAARLDAIMLRPVADIAALSELLDDARISSICIGPGYGLDGNIREAVGTVLRTGRKAVLDGDALSAFADDPDALFEQLHAKAVLTPHEGEFARLFPDLAARLTGPAREGPAYSKIDAARDARERAGCTIVLKGPDTVIAMPPALVSPEGGLYLNSASYERAAPWLATAGSGDVLAGLIAGLNADPASAVWLHGEAARAFGPGLIAEDLPEMLPKVFRDLGL